MPADDPAQHADFPALGARPMVPCVKVASGSRHRGTFHQQPQVAPVVRAPVAEILRGDVGAADDRGSVVNYDQLLVIAQEVAAPVAGMEQAQLAAKPLQRLEEGRTHPGSEAVDHEADRYAPLRGPD